MVLVSACLVGVHCRYDGSDSFNKELLEKLEGTPFVPICPEQLGGLPTPRVPAEIDHGDGHDVLEGEARVINEQGEDVTAHFLQGAQEALRIAVLTGCRRAFLKARSPSCGCGSISRQGEAVQGDGVTAALLKRQGIEVTEIP